MATRNLSVIARNQTDGYFYPGYVAGSAPTTNCDIEDDRDVGFLNLRPQTVPAVYVITLGGAVPWPELRLWDYVLTEVRSRTENIERYIPGRVVKLPILPTLANRFFTIRLFNGRKVQKRRRQVVKIGREKYIDIVKTIIDIHRGRSLAVSAPNVSQEVEPEHRRFQNRKVQVPNSWSAMSSACLTSSRGSFSSRFWSARGDMKNKRPFVTRSAHTDRGHSRRSLRILKEVANLQTGASASASSTNVSQKSSSNLSKTKSYSSESFVKSKKSSGSLDSITSSSSSASSSRPSTALSRGAKNENRFSDRNRNNRKEELVSGLEVLARWRDDGWFYYGRINGRAAEGGYEVRDVTGHVENISRDDILLEEEKIFQAIQPGDYVVALHPDYVYSYAPARVESVYSYGANVVFYDDATRNLPWQELYKISAQKYDQSVQYIRECEDSLCNSKAVVWDRITGYFRLNDVESPAGHQAFFLPLQNGSYVKQRAVHIFSVEQLRSITRGRQAWNYVLGPVDGSCTLYLPAQITGPHPLSRPSSRAETPLSAPSSRPGSRLETSMTNNNSRPCSRTDTYFDTPGQRVADFTYSLNFCNGSVTTLETLDFCYYLNADYYKFAVNFYQQNHYSSYEELNKHF
ncbi:VWA3B-like protein [Mya arenaria]|uniref:VWA3B-like protein n=1 Tax=Mya arenaria TaxID=6604 RepID=A0ABY7DS85_MYAAR|nr:uncharacterized protein LOC128228488 [Mya arenaria]WAQ99963.1 VWA3B-like protein [Mya arenaria]